MNKNKTKGNELEEAIETIQRIIFERNPALKHANYFLEPQKIIFSNGVSHEIDLYANIDLGDGHRFIEIFECKNWNKKISKNEIIVFSEKIKALNANRGYFIAKEFSKDAYNQAKTDGRIDIVKFVDKINLNRLNFDGTFCQLLSFNVLIDDKPTSFPMDCFVSSNEGTIKYEDFVKNIITQVLSDLAVELELTDDNVDCKTYVRQANCKFETPTSINSIYTYNFCIICQIKVSPLTTVIRSQFDILKKGRIINVDYLDEDGNIIDTTTFSQLDENGVIATFKPNNDIITLGLFSKISKSTK